ncbi:putative serine-threonine protein kinase [Blumeria hordei DH14]|uniref:Putative serine-threonine protein kinase n=1 Tax=Blumeria graminis f. sp. hordei (strain DH14) TaxID=546991 RepID=N1JB59_BLUG1|nr:putative serine-threonine protein kinase [Blumeria hordei DH14]
MQPLSHKAGSQSRKVKLAHSYQELLHEFSSKDLRTVGNYALGRLIGKGSFGKVYLASHKLTNGSKVVLKSAKKDDSNLAREIHHHRQFIHPHIARLYEVIITENLVWLVLEYCPGDELYNYLLKHGTLSVEKVQKVFTQLVGAVAYVHAASCVHRDLKLENIMLDRNENVKLCDFGFTREYEGKGNYLQTYCGTVAYSAPEMLKGEKYAGEKVDVWSLGVILYALLCGELPFDEDDENATRMKILTSEPKWPNHLTPDARSLLGLLLSKRTLIRPTLSDILEHPFLNEYAPQQLAILKHKHPPPFSTQLEKETLQRMRSAGVDVDQVIENVMAKSCDALAGWWALLIEKEQRKQLRRERKRKERETENRGSRRLSGASNGRLDFMSTSIAGICEEGSQTRSNESPKIRGRKERRSTHFSDESQDLPGLPEHPALFNSEVMKSPPPIEKDALRSSSSSRQRRPPPPPKEGTIRGAKSRGSTLQLVTPNHELLDSKSNNLMVRAPRRKHQHSFINQLAHWKHWIIDSAKRTKSPNRKSSKSTIELHEKTSSNPRIEMDSPNSKPAASKATLTKPNTSSWSQSNPPPTKYSNSKSKIQTSMPLTPRGTFRYSNIGLRGRKSTSSSVSSVRSIHHHNHTHSKASSTSSDCSISTSKFSLTSRSSPHHSVKVLPATPIAGSFPSNIRVVRQPTSLTLNEVPWRNNASGGIVFAKRKKKILKGPMLSMSSPTGTSLVCHSRSTSQGGRGSGEIIQEEDEDDIEEVDAFSPTAGPGEIEEPVFPAGEALNDIKVMLESG